jgi:hypothetical protein
MPVKDGHQLIRGAEELAEELDHRGFDLARWQAPACLIIRASLDQTP